MDSFDVMVVDDEPDLLDTLVKRLIRRNLRAEGAESGEKALEMIRQKEFDVVILDVKMPGGMDGIETLREIKKIRPRTEVILLTGHASVETSIEGTKLGAFDYILKPVTMEDLLPRVISAFERKTGTPVKPSNCN